MFVAGNTNSNAYTDQADTRVKQAVVIRAPSLYDQAPQDGCCPALRTFPAGPGPASPTPYSPD